MARFLLVMLLLSACTKVPSLDRDGDGFPDWHDVCADVRGEAPDGCPRRDEDGDGVLEVLDGCPDVAGEGDDGCPRDADGDSIPDAKDLCPESPETHNAFQDEDGCPDVLPHQMGNGLVLKPIGFAAGKSALGPQWRPAMDQLAAVMNENPTIRLMISGHTDAQEKSPAALSLRRAATIRKGLIERGVAADRLEIRGVGADEPVDTDETAAGRENNRRVGLTILTD